MNKETIQIGGVEITREDYPHLFRMGQRNPEGLLAQLKGLAKATGSQDLQSVAMIFENDLEHDS
ncbi:MAG: hypothetical protein WC269_05845 [Candidatus Gracilibacteria bacterium]